MTRLALLTCALAVAGACRDSTAPAGADADQPKPASTATYWTWTVAGEVTSIADRDGRRYLEARRAGGPRWIALEDVDRMPDKAEAIVDGVRELLDIASSRVDGPKRFEQLARWTGVTFDDLDAVAAWDRANGDFLVWSASADRVVIDRARQARRQAAAVDGVRVSLTVGAEAWVVGDELPAAIRVDNVGDGPRTIETQWPMIRLTVESFDTFADTLMRTPAPRPSPRVTLEPGQHTDVVYNLADVVRSPKPGPHTVVAKVGAPPNGGWEGNARSLRHFLDIKKPRAEKGE